MDIREAQAALVALGYAVTIDGKMGPQTRTNLQAFQRGAAIAADGVLGPLTGAALKAAVIARGVAAVREPAPHGVVPADWMPAARLERIIVHWTAGAHKASGLDKSHYHILIEADATLVRGAPSIAANGIGAAGGVRASHTLNCNTGSIGVSLCCMAGAIESPFKTGGAPMTAEQWRALPSVLADLCRRYTIPVTPATVLSHAEVQGTLGIKQRGKWDIARVVPVPSLVGAKACGDAFRAATAGLL